MALTRRQKEVLDTIRRFIDANGYSPSLEEIGAALGLSSVATVHKHVTHLVEKGLVRRVWNQNRSIELLDEGEGKACVAVPVSGAIAGGRPLSLTPVAETVAVPGEMASGRARLFALRAQGAGLEASQVRDGDLLIVEDRKSAEDGETVLASVPPAGDATLGQLATDSQGTRVLASGPGRPATIPLTGLEVHGVLLGLIRRYRA
jgi:repressor LexA